MTQKPLMSCRLQQLSFPQSRPNPQPQPLPPQRRSLLRLSLPPQPPVSIPFHFQESRSQCTATTSTATAVQTVQANPCADPVLYTSTRPDYPGSAWGVKSDSNSPKDCCQRCFGSNAGCLFWQFSNYVCTQYVIPNKSDAVSCVTKSCRKGRPALVSVAGDGTTYGVGICAASGFSG